MFSQIVLVFDSWIAMVGGFLVAAQFFLAAAVILRVILTRHPPGSAFAWILLTVILPYIGFFLYLMIGERPIGRWREFRLKRILESWRPIKEARKKRFRHFSHSEPALSRMAENLGAFPMTAGSDLELISESVDAFDRIAQDISRAQKSVCMEFYIWQAGGRIDAVMDALVAAAARGVKCRVLLDDIGSYSFVRSPQMQRMKDASIEARVAFPVHVFPLTHGRSDIRLHRKTVIIDDFTGYTGSLNMIDSSAVPGEAHWSDAVVRITGPCVEDLSLVFMFDWALQHPDEETDEKHLVFPECPETGSADVMVIPSGAGLGAGLDAYPRLILEAVARAQKSILITTPYFIPGETLAMVLQNAALRGVDVRLCVPRTTDSKLVTLAGRRYYSDLLDCGVKIMTYEKGMLHTKAITIDDTYSLFGTVNFDHRSMLLNFEMMMFISDARFVRRLADLQRSYEAQSSSIDQAGWHRRGFKKRFLEGFSFLLSPLL